MDNEILRILTDMLAGMESRLNKRLDSFGERLDVIEKRLDKIEERLDGIDKRIEEFESEVLNQFKVFEGTVDKKLNEQQFEIRRIK